MVVGAVMAAEVRQSMIENSPFVLYLGGSFQVLICKSKNL